MSGQDDPRLEVVRRTLRVVDGVPAKAAAAAGRGPRAGAAGARAEPAAVPAEPVVAAPEPVPARRLRRRATVEAGAGDRGRADGLSEDLLDMDLDLEADLGIDTVKQAEVFATIREAYGIERDDSLKLRDYPTLNTSSVRARAAPQAAPAAPAAPVRRAGRAEPPAGDGVEARVLAIVAEQTGYPEDLLDMDLDLEADLGIDTVKQAEVFATIREAYGIERDDSLKLRDYPTLNRGRRLRARADAAGRAGGARAGRRGARAGARGAGSAGRAMGWRRKVLAIVAAQTGYPEDLLDMDLDLEADLGIDTVKQAEVFATIREAYGIERDDSLKLRDYPTLTAVVGFVRERTPQAAPAAPEPVVAAPEPVLVAPEAPAGDGVEAKVLAIVAAQTGYPEDLLDMDLDLEADLGIDTVKQAEVFATIREAYGIERDDSLKLRDYPTMTAVVGFVRERTPQAAPPEPVAEPEPATETDARSRRRLPAPRPRARPAAAARALRRDRRPAGRGQRACSSSPTAAASPPRSTKRLQKLGVEVVSEAARRRRLLAARARPRLQTTGTRGCACA